MASTPNIVIASNEFEVWLGQRTELDRDALERKHEQMRVGAFPFLRASFYRWVQSFQVRCSKLAAGPQVLAVGDLHVENFGTWRDEEGRLVWGVNDFDEASFMSYASDLVRLCVSATLAIKDTKKFSLSDEEACAEILEGYADGLKKPKGYPFVLGHGDHETLHEMAKEAFKKPEKFWKKLDDETDEVGDGLPPDAREALDSLCPAGAEARSYRRLRPVKPNEKPKGLGSVGRRRFYLFAEWQGSRIVREAKAVAPSAWFWALNRSSPYPIYIQTILNRAKRSPDPLLAVHDRWIVRRLAPDCAKIELDDLEKSGEAEERAKKLFHAMGKETANVHLGSEGIGNVEAHYAQSREAILAGVTEMLNATREDQSAFASNP
jgi:hypothetical protein